MLPAWSWGTIMKLIAHFDMYSRASREPAGGTTSADRVADYVIETLDQLNHLARSAGQADMAEALNQAFQRCLAVHIAAKSAQLSARIDAGQATGDLPFF